jgi:hypothetical protein
MATTTLYVKDADLPLVEKAKEKLGDSLSATFIDCIRQRLQEQEQDLSSMDRITIETRSKNGAPTIRKSFEGRWLVCPESDDLTAEPDNSGVGWDYNIVYGLARTRKGALVVYEHDPRFVDGAATMEIYDSFDEIKNARDNGYQMYPDNVIGAFAEVLGETHSIDLDI